MEALKGETMTGILLSSDGLTNMEHSLRNQIEEMRRNALHLIHQRAAKVEEHLRETKLRHLRAREVLANSLGALANLVTLRWARLSEWQSFDLGGPQIDYECKLGFSDYLDVLNFNIPGAEGAVLSKSTDVDDILDQCSQKGWPYPSMEWSPPRPSLQEAQTATEEALPLELAPASEAIVVEVPEVVKPQDGHTTSTEPEGETPAVDLDLETDSHNAGLTPQTGVEFPAHAENGETVKSVQNPMRSEEAGEEAESDSLHALNQAAEELAEAEQAVSKPLATPGDAPPLPRRTEVLTRTPQIEQEPKAEEQKISQLQKKQRFKAAEANAATAALKKVLLNLARKRDPALFQQSIKRLDALEIG
eukprot:s1474_g17.t1